MVVTLCGGGSRCTIHTAHFCCRHRHPFSMLRHRIVEARAPDVNNLLVKQRTKSRDWEWKIFFFICTHHDLLTVQYVKIVQPSSIKLSCWWMSYKWTILKLAQDLCRKLVHNQYTTRFSAQILMLQIYLWNLGVLHLISADQLLRTNSYKSFIFVLFLSHSISLALSMSLHTCQPG